MPQIHPAYRTPFPGFPPLGPIPQPAVAPQAPVRTPASTKPGQPAPVSISPRLAPVPQPSQEPDHPAKAKVDPSGHRNIQPKRTRESKRLHHRIFTRSMMPLVFTAATVVLIFGVLKVLKRQGRPPGPPPIAATGDEKPESGKTPESSPSNGEIRPAAPADQPVSNDSHLPLPVEEAELRPSAASEALAVLEHFLKASSLEERLPIMETKETEGDLAESILTGPLPSFRNLIIDSQQRISLENIVDFYFSFDFINKDGSSDPQIMVVRQRGGLNPRVLADPFLDLYGGRMAAYAEKPQPKGRLFHAIVSPMPSCNDLRIPDRQKKLTLRLSSHEDSPHVTLAYASRISKIGEMLTKGSYDLSYGKPKACVILLGWNTQESPEVPYLEALDIKAFHWNP